MVCEFLNDIGICRIKSKVCKTQVNKCKLLNELKEDKPFEDLYAKRDDVICLKCGHRGAIRSYGRYYPYGLPAEVIKSCPAIYGKYIDKPYMSNAVGFGGTIPFKCTNCGNVGLIDFGGLEGYSKAFESVK